MIQPVALKAERADWCHVKHIYAIFFDEKLNQGLHPRRTLILVKVTGGSKIKILQHK